MASSYTVDLHRLAIREARRVYKWYFSRSPSSAGRFQKSFERVIARIAASPLGCASYVFGTRVCKLEKFPYLMVFEVKPAELFVLAIAHAKRRPGYWIRRRSRP